MSQSLNFDSAIFVEPLRVSVTGVVSTMAQVELALKSHKVQSCPELGAARGDVSGVISISAQDFSGTMVLSFESQLIRKIYSNILGGEDVPEINADVRDAVMELTNVIFGNAKRDINKLGYDIQPARPSVIDGAGHRVHHNPKGQCLSLLFQSAHGALNVEWSVARA